MAGVVSLPTPKRLPKPGTRSACYRFLHVLDHVHRRRPPEPRQRRSRQRIPIVDRPRRFAFRHPPYEALDNVSVSSPLSFASSSTETSIRSVDSPARNVSVPLVPVYIVPGP